MPQDYAKKPRRRRSPQLSKPMVPAWVWLFTGTVLGAFIMFLAYLSGLTLPSKTTDGNASDTNIEATQKRKTTRQPDIRFEFYKLLKESEVVIQTPSQGNIEDIEAPKENVEFILQVGSFKSPKDADRLRAELILLNLAANVETVEVRNGETWHRVLVGPFTTGETLANARRTLANNNIDIWLLKRNKGG